MADFGFSKPALQRLAKELAESLGCDPPAVFYDGDGIPETRPWLKFEELTPVGVRQGKWSAFCC